MYPERTRLEVSTKVLSVESKEPDSFGDVGVAFFCIH